MEIDEYQQQSRLTRPRRRNAMANIFENMDAEDMLLLNLDYEINKSSTKTNTKKDTTSETAQITGPIEKRQQLEHSCSFLGKHHHHHHHRHQIAPTQILDTHSLALMADHLNKHLSDLMQDKNKILKTN